MMTRTSHNCDLGQAFFPVKEIPIFLEGFGVSRKPIPGYKAIVEMESGKALSVVSSNYRLIRNEEAYKIADIVVRSIFEGKTLRDFSCYNIHMPKTKGSCRIDLIIENHFNQLFGNPSESWTPFVRISNSYNRTLTLRYDIGLCRWICKNGVIFGHKGISFSVTHEGRITDKEIDRLIERAKSNIGSIGSLWHDFEVKMNTLHEIALPASSALAIYCKAFGISVKKDDVTKAQESRLALCAKQIVTASKDYFKELGNNAYAMMNVLTDYASFPEWANGSTNYVDGYQRRVGRWVDEFLQEHGKQNFSLSAYIGDEYQNTAYYLESLVPQE
ncbi:MAG: DUF932 domain-containing protein [Muribaculaceae bacterium]|nr:DUF932 domain-containing protein [Muribaculaceae bacterium]